MDKLPETGLPEIQLPEKTLPENLPGKSAVEFLVSQVLEGIKFSGNDEGKVSGTGWRTEANGSGKYKGRYYCWRTGSKQNRVSRRGGKLSELNTDRQERYRKRSAIRDANRAARNLTAGTSELPESRREGLDPVPEK